MALSPTKKFHQVIVTQDIETSLNGRHERRNKCPFPLKKEARIDKSHGIATRLSPQEASSQG